MQTAATLSLQIPTIPCDSQAELLRHLERLPPDTYLLRGQAGEYRRRWPIVAGTYRALSEEDLGNPNFWQFDPPTLQLPIPLTPGLLDLPSLIPTQTRVYERYLAGQLSADDEVFDESIAMFGSLACLFVVSLGCLLLKDHDAIAWLDKDWNGDPPFHYKIRSIGQHYGMDTGLLDATSSLAVALWFATHDFQTGDYRPNRAAVLYRIDRPGLALAEEWLRSLPEHEGQFDAATIDLRDTPAAVAPRAIRQQGWSLVGWDHPRMMIRMVTTGGLHRYVFPTGDGPEGPNLLHRDWLVPPRNLDPARSLFEFFGTLSIRTLADAQRWVDQYWNVACAEPITLDAEGLWLDFFGKQIRPVLDYWENRLRTSLNPIATASA